MAVQELSLFSPLECGSHDAISVLESELSGIVAKPLACHRHCALLFDDALDHHVCNVQVGHYHVACLVYCGYLQLKLMVVSAHLPHSARPLEDFRLALASLREDLLLYAGRDIAIILLLGDLNEIVVLIRRLRAEGLQNAWITSCIHSPSLAATLRRAVAMNLVPLNTQSRYLGGKWLRSDVIMLLFTTKSSS